MFYGDYISMEMSVFSKYHDSDTDIWNVNLLELLFSI